MKKNVIFSIEEKTIEWLEELAKKDHRSLDNWFLHHFEELKKKTEEAEKVLKKYGFAEK